MKNCLPTDVKIFLPDDGKISLPPTVKTWRNQWYKPDDSFSSFAERFTAAKKDFALFIDNSRMHPSNGILKLWEKEPEEIERLMYLLLSDVHGDVDLAQEHMDTFVHDYELLRQKHYPGNWSYKQDRHSASVFMAMSQPDFHYVYKASEADKMARYIDFDSIIGAGSHFSLASYYRMGDVIVEALRMHPTLLEKHFNKVEEVDLYRDDSLHLLAFDLMYCCKSDAFYTGLVPSSIGKNKKKTEKVYTGPSPEELARIEEEQLQKIAELEAQIDELENSYDGCEDISLIGVQVTFPKYGIGTVIAQKINKVTVRFSDTEKDFVLDKQYSQRPQFENDEEIVEAFTVYGRAQEKIEKLQKQLDALQK